MAKQRHIGFIIFGVCSVLSARIAFFTPKQHILTPDEAQWGVTDKNERAYEVIRGLRYYIFGIGVLGLLMVVEDYFDDKAKKRRANLPPRPPQSFPPRR